MALCALEGENPGVKLHIVTDSELLYLSLKGKCGKCRPLLSGWLILYRGGGWVGQRPKKSLCT